MPVISSLSPTIKLQIVLFGFPYISYRSSGENWRRNCSIRKIRNETNSFTVVLTRLKLKPLVILKRHGHAQICQQTWRPLLLLFQRKDRSMFVLQILQRQSQAEYGNMDG